jgi:hypothetical protein
MNLFKFSGYMSVVLGLLSALCLFSPASLFFSLLFAIIGFIFSTINIYLNAKYEITKSNLSIGYIGLILSSVPVIFLLYLIITHK